MIASFILIFACIFPFGKVNTENLSEVDNATVSSVLAEHIDPADNKSPIIFNGRIGVLSYLFGSTGVVESTGLTVLSIVLLLAPVLMFVVFFLWRWISDTVTGIIMLGLSGIELVFILLFDSVAKSALETCIPAIKGYDIFSATPAFYATICGVIVIILLSVLLTIWNKLFAIKKSA